MGSFKFPHNLLATPTSPKASRFLGWRGAVKWPSLRIASAPQRNA